MSILIANPATPPMPTGVRTTDARGALIRGLAEYLRGLKMGEHAGRTLEFHRVVEGWSEPEENARYPAAVVDIRDRCTLDASGFTPNVSAADRLPGGRFLVAAAELVADLTIEVTANDPNTRALLCLELEDALNPVDYMYGFKLDLPHYCGQRAVFEPKAILIADSEDEVAKRYRRATFIVEGRVPVTRVSRLPNMHALPRVDVGDRPW